MARLFNGSSEYLEVDSAPATVVPITMGGWFQSDTPEQSGTLVGLVDKDQGDERFLLLVDRSASRTVDAFVQGGPAGTSQASVGPVSTDTWHHAVARYDTVSSRFAFLDGVKSTEDTNTLTADDIDRVSIGRSGDSTPSAFLSGIAAEVFIYNVALTDDEVIWLSKGYSPLTLTHRLANLVLYKDLIRDINRPYFGPTLVATGSSVTAHPRIYYPAPAQIITPAAADGAVTVQTTSTGIGSVTSTAQKNADVTSTVSGIGAAATVITKAIEIASTASGVGSVESTAQKGAQVDATTSGIGAVTTTAQKAVSISSTVSGVGSAESVVTKAIEISATTSGIGTVTTAVTQADGEVTQTTTTGVGAVTTTAQKDAQIDSTSSGVGAVATTATKAVSISTSTSGKGQAVTTVEGPEEEDEEVDADPQIFGVWRRVELKLPLKARDIVETHERVRARVEPRQVERIHARVSDVFPVESHERVNVKLGKAHRLKAKDYAPIEPILQGLAQYRIISAKAGVMPDRELEDIAALVIMGALTAEEGYGLTLEASANRS